MSYENLAKLSKYFRMIQEKDRSDVFIGVTGRKGVGKTTFSINSSRNYVGTYMGVDHFGAEALRKYVAYNNSDVFDKMQHGEEFSPIAGDEAIRFAWSRDWNKSDNKDLTRLSTQIRPKRHILYFNLPRISWIDRAYREGMLTMWAWIHAEIVDGEKHSYAIIFEPDENQGITDSWHLRELKEISGNKRIGRFTPMEDMYTLVKKHPCFFDMIRFPPLPVDLEEKYLEIRSQNVMGQESGEINQRDVAKVICYHLMKNWPALFDQVQQGRFERPTYQIIAETLTKNPVTGKQMALKQTVNKWVKEITELMPKQAQSLIDDADHTIEGENEEAA